MTTDTELPPRLLVPIEEARAILGGITRPTLYRLINDRELERVKIGARAFILATSLREFVDRRLRKSAEELDAEAAEAGDGGGDAA